MLVVAAVEEDGLLGWAVAPVRRGVVQGRVTRPGFTGQGPNVRRTGYGLGVLFVQESDGEARARGQ